MRPISATAGRAGSSRPSAHSGGARSAPVGHFVGRVEASHVQTASCAHQPTGRAHVAKRCKTPPDLPLSCRTRHRASGAAATSAHEYAGMAAGAAQWRGLPRVSELCAAAPGGAPSVATLPRRPPLAPLRKKFYPSWWEVKRKGRPGRVQVQFRIFIHDNSKKAPVKVRLDIFAKTLSVAWWRSEARKSAF